MLTRKDFVDLAEVIEREMGFLAEADRVQVAELLADSFCRRQNPRFDRDRFLRACFAHDGLGPSR